MRQTLCLSFSVQCNSTNFGDGLVVTGSCAELGSWAPSHGLKLDGHSWPTWSNSVVIEREVDAANDRQSWVLELKAVVVRGSGRQDWEQFSGNRVLIVDVPEASMGFSPLERPTSFLASFSFVFSSADASVQESLHIRADLPHSAFRLAAPVPSTVIPPAPVQPLAPSSFPQLPGRVILLSAGVPTRGAPQQPAFRPLPGNNNIFASPLTRGRSVPVGGLQPQPQPIPIRRPVRRCRSLSLPRINEDPELESEAEREHRLHWASSTPPAAPASWHAGGGLDSSPDDSDEEAPRPGRVPALWLAPSAQQHLKPVVAAIPFAGLHAVTFH
eukprot:tig00021105_g18241.t1